MTPPSAAQRLAHTRIWLVGSEDHWNADEDAFAEIEAAADDGKKWVQVRGLGGDWMRFRIDQIQAYSAWDPDKAAEGSRRFKEIKEWWEENCSTPEERWS